MSFEKTPGLNQLDLRMNSHNLPRLVGRQDPDFEAQMG
jgi:hypothetical protein